MAGRIRTIKPELLEDSRTAALDGDSFRVFIGMLLLADDHGNLRAAPELLKAQIFWACPPSRDPRETLARLSRAGLVRLYLVREQEYGHLAGWDKHQRVDHPSKPRMPGPADAEAIEMTYGGDLSREILASPREILASPRESLATDLRPPTSDHRPPTPELLCAAPAARESDARVAHDVIHYLNAKAGTKFRASDSHVRFIAARRAEGYGPDDFRRVVDDRVSEWGNDEKMWKFLRPKTLFNKTNFDSYVDEAASAARRPRPGSDGPAARLARQAIDQERAEGHDEGLRSHEDDGNITGSLLAPPSRGADDHPIPRDAGGSAGGAGNDSPV